MSILVMKMNNQCFMNLNLNFTVLFILPIFFSKFWLRLNAIPFIPVTNIILDFIRRLPLSTDFQQQLLLLKKMKKRSELITGLFRMKKISK